jgi:hypothetical protein
MRASTIEPQHLVQCCGAGLNVPFSELCRERLAGINFFPVWSVTTIAKGGSVLVLFWLNPR